MGTYTTFKAIIELETDLPTEVRQLINAMIRPPDHWVTPANLPDHPLFQTDRWWLMLDESRFSDNILYADCNFKNYDNEINKFLHWIAQYTVTRGYLGYFIKENDLVPTLIYMYRNNDIHFYKPYYLKEKEDAPNK